MSESASRPEVGTRTLRRLRLGPSLELGRSTISVIGGIIDPSGMFVEYRPFFYATHSESLEPHPSEVNGSREAS